MKTRAILLLLICLNCTAFAQRNNPVITSFGKINLDGHWKGDDFGDEVGSDITVTIVGKNQILLSHSLLIDIPGKYCIPIDAYTPGVYLLELSNS